MAEEQATERPIGWWLKQADARLDAAFDLAVTDLGADRRGWQILSVLAVRPTAVATVIAALAAFDSEAAVTAALEDLTAKGMVEQDAGMLRLTLDGARQHAALGPNVDAVRQRVREALPNDDYVALVELLARLVAALEPPAE